MEHCPQCGVELESGSAEGLCAGCLFAGGVSPSEDTETQLTMASAGIAVNDPSQAALENDSFGLYQIVHLLGEGGMGTVYLAEQGQPIRRRVALKVIKAGMDTREILSRFAYERQALALMDHPNIARVYDAGASEKGRPYFVMEYIDGVPITHYCDEHRLNTRERLELFAAVCLALQHAHSKGVIHRDIKPSNVLVVGQEGCGVPKVIDFGIAKATDHRGFGTAAFTRLGQFIGTPEYMSPEQADLVSSDIDTSSDVYSLGVLLYELLVGGVPFEKATLRKAGMEELLRIIREDEAPSLPAKLTGLGKTLPQIAEHRRTDPGSLKRQVAGDLNWIVMKALEKERQRRYHSVADLAADVHRYLTDQPVLASPPGVLYRAGKFVRRNRIAVLAGVVVLVTLICGVVGIVWESHRADIQRKQAEQRLSQAVGMAEQTLKDINGSIAFLPGSTEARRQMVRDILDYLNRLSKDSGEDPRVLTALATAYMRVGDVLGNSNSPNLGDLPGSLATYQRALGVLQPLAARDAGNMAVQLLVSEAHSGIGTLFQSLGRTKEAESEFRAVVALTDKALLAGPDNPDTQLNSIDAHYSLDLLRYTYQPEEANKDMQLYLPMALKLSASHPESMDIQRKLADIYSLIGSSLNRLGRQSETLNYHRKAVEVREAIYRRNPHDARTQRDLMIGYGHVGDMLGNPFTGCLGDYRSALEYFGKAARIAEEMSRTDPYDTRASLDVAMSWTRIGAARQASGDPRKSNEDLDRAIARFEPLAARSPGNATYSRESAIAYEYRGRNMWLLGDRKSAMHWFQKSLAVSNQLLAAHPADHLARAQRLVDEGPIAVLRALDGDRAGAIKMAQALIPEATDLSSNGRKIAIARAWRWYGETYEALGDCRTAGDAYARSVAAWQQEPGFLETSPFREEMRDAQRKAAKCRAKAGGNVAEPGK